MASDLYSGTDVVLQNEENALWDLEKSEFPVTLYDRPGLALSNLLLRGDVDAATRAIFSPQSLTPAEMQTMSRQLVGDSKSKILKTIADVVTNPLVLLGVVMAFKYPIGKSNAVFEVGKGLATGKPGPLMSQVQSAFNGLRDVPQAFRSLFGMAKASGEMNEKFSTKFSGLIEKYTQKTGSKLTADDMLRVSADNQGFGEALKWSTKEGKKVYDATRGYRKYATQVTKVHAADTPMWPGLRKSMSPELRGLSDGIKGWY